MRRFGLVGMLALTWLGSFCATTRAGHCGGWSVGVNLGYPGYYRPWGCYYADDYYYYRPYPVYVAAPPVVVQAAPVAVPVAQPVQQRLVAEPVPALTAVSYQGQADIDRNVALLADGNDNVRMEAVMQLGKLKAGRAVDPVAATLAGDRSPAVREAAARALGLIGSSKGLPALKYAAQADNDRDVRHSAQFAVEIIQSNMKR